MATLIPISHNFVCLSFPNKVSGTVYLCFISLVSVFPPREPVERLAIIKIALKFSSTICWSKSWRYRTCFVPILGALVLVKCWVSFCSDPILVRAVDLDHINMVNIRSRVKGYRSCAVLLWKTHVLFAFFCNLYFIIYTPICDGQKANKQQNCGQQTQLYGIKCIQPIKIQNLAG